MSGEQHYQCASCENQLFDRCCGAGYSYGWKCLSYVEAVNATGSVDSDGNATGMIEAVSK